METAQDTPRFKVNPLEAIEQWATRLIAKPSFQNWASRFPLSRRVARKDGEKLFDLVAGFVYSQTLFACVELDLFQRLAHRSETAEDLAKGSDLTTKRMTQLCDAATSIGLFRKRRDGRYALARLGAALIGVPGLMEMIRHHDILYRDLSNPVALLKDEVDTELAAFWPYVLGETGTPPDPGAFARYSDLMSDSQALVAQETLQIVPFKGSKVVMDVGGGSGAFLRHVGNRRPDLKLVLFDLPEVVADVRDIETIGGSFTNPLPKAADTITLIRVLYDHSDEKVEILLRNVLEALPVGGQIVISEPMSGGDKPNPATDGYFSFYTMAMRTGQVRSQADIAGKLSQIGFRKIQTPHSARPFVTSVVVAIK